MCKKNKLYSPLECPICHDLQVILRVLGGVGQWDHSQIHTELPTTCTIPFLSLPKTNHTWHQLGGRSYPNQQLQPNKWMRRGNNPHKQAQSFPCPSLLQEGDPWCSSFTGWQFSHLLWQEIIWGLKGKAAYSWRWFGKGLTQFYLNPELRLWAALPSASTDTTRHCASKSKISWAALKTCSTSGAGLGGTKEEGKEDEPAWAQGQG